MVLSLVRIVSLTLFLLSACIGSQPPRRLDTATPITVVVHLESSSGASIPAQADALNGIAGMLQLRNLVPAFGPDEVLGATRLSSERIANILAASDTAWVMLVEARARFFSQLSGRYRWEVELRTSLVSRAEPDKVQTSDLSVAAFLSFEHEREADALSFVRRQLEADAGALIDRVLAR